MLVLTHLGIDPVRGLPGGSLICSFHPWLFFSGWRPGWLSQGVVI